MNYNHNIIKFAISLVMLLMGLFADAQSAHDINDFVYIEGLKTSDLTCEFNSSRSSLSFFKTLVGDTIEFEGEGAREDFFKSDTVWIKKGVKKPKIGKHFYIGTHYKGFKEGKYDNEQTPGEYIYNQPWIIKDVIETVNKNSYSYNKGQRLIIENVNTHDVVQWQYREEYGNTTEKIQVIDFSRSKSLKSTFTKLPLYEEEGTTFNPVKVTDVSYRINVDYFVSAITSVCIDNKKWYNVDNSSYGRATKLFTEESKESELNKLKDAGSYYLELYKVQKPANSQIRYGKTKTISDNSVTKYSYEDNYLSIVWMPQEKGFYFILKNKSGNSLKIVWDDASYMGVDNSASRVFHNGVKYIDRDKSQPATIVPNGATVEDVVSPTDKVSWLGSSWYTDPLLYGSDNGINNGKTVKVLLPISVKGVENEYTFVFKVKWNYAHPELQND